MDKPLDENTLLQTLSRVLGGHDRTRRVLVVEDDPDLAALLCAMFQRLGVEAVPAQTGRAAIELSERLAPDLLLLDLVLPDGDGFEVVTWLREHGHPQMPLVVYTSKELDDMERSRLQLGQTLFLTKSRISLEEVQERVVQLLDRVLPGEGEVRPHGNEENPHH